MRCRPLAQRNAEPTACGGEGSPHADNVLPLTLPSPSGSGFFRRGSGPSREGAGNPSPGWEKGRDEGLPLIARARRSRGS